MIPTPDGDADLFIRPLLITDLRQATDLPQGTDLRQATGLPRETGLPAWADLRAAGLRAWADLRAAGLREPGHRGQHRCHREGADSPLLKHQSAPKILGALCY